MTDEQIIIDGCDVSKCEFYNKDDKTCREVNGNYDTDICEFDKCENSNCVYKQLKRKEQECEELQNIIDEAKNSKLDLKSFLVGEAVQNEYEQQLDQLKEELQEYQDWFDEFKLMFRYDDREPDDNSELYSCLESVVDENKKLKQTIAEIKEIAKNGCYDDYGMPLDELSIILQKISEVEECKP